MVKRICPQCGIVRISADESNDWDCGKCGAVVGKELSEPAMEGVTRPGINEFKKGKEGWKNCKVYDCIFQDYMTGCTFGEDDCTAYIGHSVLRDALRDAVRFGCPNINVFTLLGKLENESEQAK